MDNYCNVTDTKLLRLPFPCNHVLLLPTIHRHRTNCPVKMRSAIKWLFQFGKDV